MKDANVVAIQAITEINGDDYVTSNQELVVTQMPQTKIDRKPANKSGPKSQAGKQKSARNAFKSGFFSKGLLPWEDAKGQEAQWKALVDYWGAHDPARVGLLRGLEFALMQQERLMVIERDKILGAMQSVDIALEFCRRSGLLTITYMNLPTWFFKIDDEGQKEWAIELGDVHAEALHLKEHYHDRLVGRIEKDYPHLYRFVMEQYKASPSFSIALGQLYKQQNTILNLAALINQLQERYPHHLTWAQDPERYQLIINGLRSEVIEKVVDVDKSIARAAAIQNRVLKSLAGLAAMNQQEVQASAAKRLSE
ncbi:hypothetical protein [Polynucleobacter sp. HIN7]|uniref:hypothetical protein n=1 Tax=Polynucleobacter sp. HIN7 TaxID=3047866 RepID=UPI00257346EB|nr:hypothetical protein [Polynucleobacter sp. HIN7]BEI36617.1 hypothetical protein PHIN7_03410 [Polynucleobacter sp. HIN7]